MSESLPETLDLRRCAEARAEFGGRLDLAAFERLSAPYRPSGHASLQLRFERDAQQRPVLTGDIEAEVQAECQRCLQPMTVTVQMPLSLFLVESEALGQRLEEEGEYLVIGTEPVTTSSLVEDELLLALPMVPTHPGCHAAVSTQQGAPEPEQETHRPFAGLAELRGLRTNDEQE